MPTLPPLGLRESAPPPVFSTIVLLPPPDKGRTIKLEPLCSSLSEGVVAEPVSVTYTPLSLEFTVCTVRRLPLRPMLGPTPTCPVLFQRKAVCRGELSTPPRLPCTRAPSRPES